MANTGPYESTLNKQEQRAPNSPPDKSVGQQLLERLLAIHCRLDSAAQQLEAVRTNLKGPRREADGVGKIAPPPKPIPVFFEAFERMADELDRVTGELETGVQEIAGLF